jgi:hypothetical protein
VSSNSSNLHAIASFLLVPDIAFAQIASNLNSTPAKAGGNKDGIV